jgi:excisionase family DNA binding protein
MDDDDPGRDIPVVAEFLTVQQLAERIRVHPHTIRSWVRRGKLESEDGLHRLRGTRRWLIH